MCTYSQCAAASNQLSKRWDNNTTVAARWQGCFGFRSVGLCAGLLQALDKARKDMEKARKVRDPLTKKLAEDPQALQAMAAEVEQLKQQLAAL